MKVKSKSDIKKSYEEGARVAPARYARGIDRTTGFREAAIAGQALYVVKMTDPTILERRKTKLERISDEDWKKPAKEKGSVRIGPGMIAASGKQSDNFEPYRSELEGLELPARTADPMTNVTNRVGGIAVALAERKKKELGE